MRRPNHASRFEGIAKTNLQASRASDTETLQSQVNKAAEKRLSLSGLEILHGRLAKSLRNETVRTFLLKEFGTLPLSLRCASRRVSGAQITATRRPHPPPAPGAKPPASMARRADRRARQYDQPLGKGRHQSRARGAAADCD